MYFTEKANRAFEILNHIESLGYDAFLVGGAVRDMIMERPYDDIDIATNCPLEKLQDRFLIVYVGRSKKFGIGVLVYDKYEFDIAQFRVDGSYSDSRHPDEVKLIGSFEDDVARRDFTINAMGMGHELKIYDFHDGLEDIQKRLIRTVGDPMERFDEDAIRMIRAARFAALLDFDIELQTRRAIKRLFRNIQKIKVERIVLELVKAAKGTGQQFARFILLLDELKLLYQILPEVVAMKYFRHDLAHHPEGPTVFDHSIECLKVLEESSNFVAKMATLLHDVGKPISFQEETHWWKFSYHRHEKKSAELARDICLRLKFSTDDLEAIVFAAKNHMKFHNILKMKPSKIARLVSDPHFDVLLHVARADEFSRGEKFIHKDQFDQAVKKIAEIEERWRNRMVKNEIKLVSGHRIMKLLSLQPGKIVGVIKGVVEDRILDEQLDPDNSELIDKIILEEGKIVLGRREDEKE